MRNKEDPIAFDGRMVGKIGCHPPLGIHRRKADARIYGAFAAAGTIGFARQIMLTDFSTHIGIIILIYPQ